MVSCSLDNYGSAQAALRNHVINVLQNHDYSFGQMGNAGEALNSSLHADHHYS